jgi:hypothetical protein
VRRELVVPLQCARFPIERENAVRIQVVSLAEVPVVFAGGIAGGPVDDIELRIVTAGEPRGRAAVLEILALPGLRPGCAGLRDRPEAPDLFARHLVERGDEPIRAMLSAGDTGDQQIADRKWR